MPSNKREPSWLHYVTKTKTFVASSVLAGVRISFNPQVRVNLHDESNTDTLPLLIMENLNVS